MTQTVQTEKERERRALYWLCRVPGLSDSVLRNLGGYFGSFSSIYNIEERAIRQSGILNEGQLEALVKARGEFSECESQYEQLQDQGILFVTPLDEEYPKRLMEICDYPMGLFVRGRLPEDEKPAVAIVGARGCSAYGEQLAKEFGRALSSEGVQIISGLALGIDGASHRGALTGGTPTFGVLGCGVNICYPSANYALYEEMIRSGGILSEFYPGVPPLKNHFPRRNRIISGLSDAVLVVEARERSGSLITAEFALEQGRDIFAVPGRITDHLSGGCNRLIQQGAYMALSPGDILEYLGVKCGKELIIREKNVNSLAKKEKMVYSCLDFKPKHMEEILSETGLSIRECMNILLELELQGYVFRSANYYGKKI